MHHGPGGGARSTKIPYQPVTFAGVLGAVRLRIITFIIEMNRMFPSATEIESPSSEKLELVDQTLRRSFQLGRAERIVVAYTIGSVDQSISITTNAFPGDLGGPAEHSQSLNVSEEAIA